MKKWFCDGCGKKTSVISGYKPEMCCDGRFCGCYGLPINPVFCNECEKRYLGEEVDPNATTHN